MTDRIELAGMAFYGFHGVGPEERRLGQRFVVDLAVELDLSAAGRSDDIDDTVSYSSMYGVVRQIVEGPGRKLLESVAESIADAILNGFAVESVTVTLKKPEAPIKGSILSHAAVQIHRAARP